MMTVPEWVMILLVSGILATLGWSAKRLVKTNDDTASTLDSIDKSLSVMNVRLGQTEVFIKMHHEADEAAFARNDESHKEMWHAINTRGKITN